MSVPSERRLFVHLAYLDDSDTKQKPIKIQVMSGVLIEDTSFKMFDIAMHSISHELVPEEKLDQFEEFHAAELYGGYGVFEGIDQSKRFEAIHKLLSLLSMEGASVVYGAVDIAKARREIYGSADPLDIAFRICLKEISHWVRKHHFAQETEDRDEEIRRWLAALVLLIVDDCEKKQREVLQNSFRNLRHPLPSVRKTMPAGQRFPHFHDDVFFGDSRYSVGIQLADLCSYFIARHLQGEEEIKPFYDLIEPHIEYGQLYPQQQDFKPPQPTLLSSLSGLGLALTGVIDDKGIPKIRPSDDGAIEGSPQRNQEEAGSGESGETETQSGEETEAGAK